ncbi:MAG: acyltransferase [Xanthomonadaceae bacterium]|jgi:1-acyl-sn-glycerol-3-phosphate acyltransferase|nr:acyltransferase [Xanthomonadaceae bacterium]
MRSTPLTWLRAASAGAFVSANTLVHAVPILTLALAKALLPVRRARAALSRWMPALGESWIAANNWAMARFTPVRWVVTGDAGLQRAHRYLVLSNHQSWVDIPVLQKVLNRRIPFQRFFLKDSLKWVPVLGLAWWALDFPFMKRASKSQIEKRPELARRDLETARRACARFREIPVSVMNFVEGTRATAAKLSQSSYRHLLKPRSGGVAQVVNSMGELLDGILDVTIVYPQGRPSVLDLLGGRVREIRVDLRLLPVPAELLGGDYENDRAYRARFQQWLNGVWAEKDARIEALLARPA